MCTGPAGNGVHSPHSSQDEGASLSLPHAVQTQGGTWGAAAGAGAQTVKRACSAVGRTPWASDKLELSADCASGNVLGAGFTCEPDSPAPPLTG